MPELLLGAPLCSWALPSAVHAATGTGGAGSALAGPGCSP